MTGVDFNDDYRSDTDALVGTVATFMNWTGAVLSLALIGGLAYWGYALFVRDVAGVPVVRALEGPMRIAPDDPGGVQAEHQGLSVTHVAVSGAEEVPADQVILAPEPIELAEEDVSLGDLLPSDPVAVAALAEGQAIGQSVEDEPVLSAIELAIAEALGQEVGEAEVVLASLSRAPEIQVIPASLGGVATSPRPVLRPASFVRAVPVSSVPTAATLDLSVEDIELGTRLVQLGAFATPEEAQSAWDKLAGSFSDYMGDKQRLIQEAQAGGKTFYRLRAVGYEDLSDARRFCAVLVAGQANCIPVIHR